MEIPALFLAVVPRRLAALHDPSDNARAYLDDLDPLPVPARRRQLVTTGPAVVALGRGVRERGMRTARTRINIYEWVRCGSKGTRRDPCPLHA